MNAKPIPGPAVPYGYYLIPFAETLRYGDRFLSASGNWVRTGSVGTRFFSELTYARPSASIIEQEDREALLEQAARVPELETENSRLRAEIRALESTVAELEAENAYLKGKVDRLQDVLDE